MICSILSKASSTVRPRSSARSPPRTPRRPAPNRLLGVAVAPSAARTSSSRRPRRSPLRRSKRPLRRSKRPLRRLPRLRPCSTPQSSRRPCRRCSRCSRPLRQPPRPCPAHREARRTTTCEQGSRSSWAGISTRTASRRPRAGTRRWTSFAPSGRRRSRSCRPSGTRR